MSSPEETAKTLKFHFVKSTQFRVVHADGVWGGASPRGHIALAFFNERLPIPEVVEHSIDGGGVGAEIARHGRSGVVREVEFQAIMTIDVAKSLREFLDVHIAKTEGLLGEAQRLDEARKKDAS